MVVWLCWGLAALGGAFAVAISLMRHRYIVVSLPPMVMIFAIIGLFMMDLTFDSRPPGIAYGYVQGAARFILSIGYRRRVVEMVFDLSLIGTAFFGANLLRRDFVLSERDAVMLTKQAVWILMPTYGAFLIAGVYRGIWRYAGISELIRFANGSVLTGIFLELMLLFTPFHVSGSSVVVLYVVLLFNLLVLTRMSFRLLRSVIHGLAESRQRVLIVGAGVAGAAAAHYVFSGQNRHVKMVGFVDDDHFKLGKVISGHRVLGNLDDLEMLHEKCHFDEIMLAVESIGGDRLDLVQRFADSHSFALTRFSMRIDEVGLDRNGKASKASTKDDLPVLEPRQVGS
jgi:FlaA1/EpsC-like NDP-sugar epimerase